MSDYVGMACMFFAGLILLIPHRIGMSRVNYVIKRYNLPISRAGLLLYKYHNNIELSLLLGTLPGNIIVWIGGALLDAQISTISIFMIIFLIFMLLSSIYMLYIYISGGDFGHLNAFYFSLIFLTLFDGFTNAFAFAINAKFSSMLSAGIPLSGLLVTLLHYVYKFFYDIFFWDDFDYYVLRLQLLWNIIFISVALGIWSYDYNLKKSDSKKVNVPPITELFEATHYYDWFPICMLAISLGTVYAFYPSIAPYSIIDFQYASVIELWILIISAILPFVIALLDTNYNPEKKDSGQWGPSGSFHKADDGKPQTMEILTSGTNIQQHATKNMVDFTNPPQKITLSDLKVKHSANTTHPTGGVQCTVPSHDTNMHAWDKNNPNKTVTYTLQSGDAYYGASSQVTLSNVTLSGSIKPSSIKYKYYYNWFSILNPRYTNVGTGPPTITISGGITAIPYTDVKFTFSGGSTWAPTTNTTDPNWYSLWNLVWISAIFYIICIQIFMSLLHYPHCLLSCFFNDNPYYTVFISILFNTLRELMQATAFSGAGKQCKNLDKGDPESYKGKIIFGDYTITAPTASDNNPNILTSSTPSRKDQVKFAGIATAMTSSGTIDGYQASGKFKVPTEPAILEINFINGTIAATNKLITLFVMMFCVFTGDGYLQHYRRCCRDCWPTTGYNKYQSFFYWLHFGFKGGIKSITSSLTEQ